VERDGKKEGAAFTERELYVKEEALRNCTMAQLK